MKRKPGPHQFPGKRLYSDLWIKRITVQLKNDGEGRISAKIKVSQESGGGEWQNIADPGTSKLAQLTKC